ncbi:MAG: caspase family protein [Phaeodactylibacter sp.]|nr:caspase family protein [Phaeodactylibacter sp.]
MRKEIFTIIALSLLWSISSLSAQTCIEGDCENGEGTLILENGIKYVGQFKAGKYHGVGICYWPNGGGRYEGEWENNLPHGKGSRMLSTGKRQVGWFEKGIFHGHYKPGEDIQAKGGANRIDRSSTGCISGTCYDGRGVYVYSNGAQYTGWFKNGNRDGDGICHYPNGNTYEGDWKNGQPNGYGTMTYANGQECYGQWNNGRSIEGCQNITKAGSSIKSGCVSGDCLSGNGRIVYLDRSEYEGSFYKGKPSGQGVMYRVNGNRYVGEFKEGFYHGKGVLYRPNQTSLDGQWHEGEFIGKQAPLAKGCIYGDCRNGTGTYIFKNGNKYTGTFKDGYPHGKGTIIYTNGERYEGELEMGYLQGHGILFTKSGEHRSGIWHKGELVREEVEAQTPIASNTQPQQQSTTSTNNNPELEVFAVVIGVSKYTHMVPLNYTDDDAYQMYAFLKSPEGGALDDDHISILIDEAATLNRIKFTMKEVFNRAGPEDLIMLYYSGHGYADAFLPIDFNGVHNKLFHKEIIGIFERSPAKYKLCIADACYSGGMLAAKGGIAPSQLTQDLYDRLAEAAPGTALIMSSKSNETSLESKGLRQGVFSHYLIRGLKGEADRNKDRYVDISELFRFVSQNVQNYTGSQQSPMIEGDYDPEMPVSIRRTRR